jgi:hypothetical protein
LVDHSATWNIHISFLNYFLTMSLHCELTNSVTCTLHHTNLNG